MPADPALELELAALASQVADLAGKLDILASAHNDHENRLARLEGWVELLRADRRNGHSHPTTWDGVTIPFP